jgi:hypothetical protein
MEKRAILQAIISHYTGGNKALFAKKIGVTPQTINTWITRNSFDLDLIYSKCECLSAEFLLTGKGEMLKSGSPAPSAHNIYVKPSPEAQTSPKSPEPISVDFSLILERYEYLAGEVARLKDEKARTEALRIETERLQTENRELRAENVEFEKRNIRPYRDDFDDVSPPPMMVAEPKAEYGSIT